MKKYIFEGTDSSCRIHYKAIGNTIIELYNDLVNQDIVSLIDGDPYEEAVMKKAGKSWDDFKNEDGDEDIEKFNKWYNQHPQYDLTDEEIIRIISSDYSRAYYYNIKELNKSTGEYEKI